MLRGGELLSKSFIDFPMLAAIAMGGFINMLAK